MANIYLDVVEKFKRFAESRGFTEREANEMLLMARAKQQQTAAPKTKPLMPPSIEKLAEKHYN